jgi:hypothetical protein
MQTSGQIGYEAYGETASWKTFDGRPMPTWEQLGESGGGLETQRRWEVSAQAILATSTVAEVLPEDDDGPPSVHSVDDLVVALGRLRGIAQLDDEATREDECASASLCLHLEAGGALRVVVTKADPAATANLHAVEARDQTLRALSAVATHAGLSKVADGIDTAQTLAQYVGDGGAKFIARRLADYEEARELAGATDAPKDARGSLGLAVRLLQRAKRAIVGEEVPRA